MPVIKKTWHKMNAVPGSTIAKYPVYVKIVTLAKLQFLKNSFCII